METSNYIAALRAQGDLLLDAASGTDMDTPVPTCPGWCMRDLIRHIGNVQRWAAACVRDRLLERPSRAQLPAESLPDDDLVAWFRQGHQELVRVLEAADPDLVCWTFLPAPSPLTFWARRQAIEVTVHRIDAESPGSAVTPLPADLAVDGIDELLLGLLPRRDLHLPLDTPRNLQLCAVDVDRSWLVVLHPDHVETGADQAPAECAVRAGASDLFLLLWNRRAAAGLDVIGDATVLDMWRAGVRI